MDAAAGTPAKAYIRSQREFLHQLRMSAPNSQASSPAQKQGSRSGALPQAQGHGYMHMGQSAGLPAGSQYGAGRELFPGFMSDMHGKELGRRGLAGTEGLEGVGAVSGQPMWRAGGGAAADMGGQGATVAVVSVGPTAGDDDSWAFEGEEQAASGGEAAGSGPNSKVRSRFRNSWQTACCRLAACACKLKQSQQGSCATDVHTDGPCRLQATLATLTSSEFTSMVPVSTSSSSSAQARTASATTASDGAEGSSRELLQRAGARGSGSGATSARKPLLGEGGGRLASVEEGSASAGALPPHHPLGGLQRDIHVDSLQTHVPEVRAHLHQVAQGLASAGAHGSGASSDWGSDSRGPGGGEGRSGDMRALALHRQAHDDGDAAEGMDIEGSLNASIDSASDESGGPEVQSSAR